MNGDAVFGGVLLAVALLGAGLVTGIVAERLVIPDSVALLVVGIAAGSVWTQGRTLAFGPVLLLIFLPPLLFEAAWSLDLASARRSWRGIVVLAVPGVVLTAGAIGCAVALSGTMALVPALLLGAILSATDPIAVVAVFRQLKVPVDIATLVEGESIVNDGTAFLLFNLFLALATATSLNVALVKSAVFAPLGGVLIGFAVAGVIALAVRGLKSHSLEVLATIVAAYGSYLMADRLGCSGIFATATAALALRFVATFPLDSQTDEIDRFWAVIAFLANAFVFLLMGVNLQLDRMLHEPVVVAVTIAALVVSRLALAYGILPAVRVPGDRMARRHVVALAGIRGGLSLALALSLPVTIAARPVIIDVVFAVVTVTLIVQGVAIRPILSRLRL